MNENVKHVNPYHLMLGVVIGAGGVVAAIQLAKVVNKLTQKSTAKNQCLGAKERLQRASLYHSPDPPHRDEYLRSDERLDVSVNTASPDSFTPPQVHTPRPHLSNSVIENLSEEDDQVNPENEKETETLLNLLYNIGETQSKQDNVLHRGISCNICSSHPLMGVRFKCVNCVDYDVCSRCEPSCDHDLTHVFVKISIPIPPLANPRTALLPVFYPGKKARDSVLPWQHVLRLREQSHFDATYVEVLYEQFKSLCNEKGVITKDVFQFCLGPLTSKKNLVVEQLFCFYDVDDDGFINFDNFIHGMSILAKGTKTERMKYIFRGYDLDNDGFISRDDFQQMLKAYHQLSMELVRDVVRSCEEEMMATYDDTGNRPISAVFNAPIPESGSTGPWSKKRKTFDSFVEESAKELLWQNNTSHNSTDVRKSHERLSAVEAMTQDAISELVDQIMQNADLDKDGKLSEHEFFQYAITDTSLLAWFEAIDTVF